MVSARSGVFFWGAVHARRRGQLEPSVSWALGKKRTRREIAARVKRGGRPQTPTRVEVREWYRIRGGRALGH